MKRSKFSEAQIAFILRQGDEETAVGEICRKAITYLPGRGRWRAVWVARLKPDQKPERCP